MELIEIDAPVSRFTASFHGKLRIVRRHTLWLASAAIAYRSSSLPTRLVIALMSFGRAVQQRPRQFEHPPTAGFG